MCVGDHDDDTIAFCKSKGITYEAYGPLRSVNLSDKRIQTIANAHGVSTAQVSLRWVTQQGSPVAVSPGLNPEYAAEDMGLGSFTLTAAEMGVLSSI
jgi:diketogulonate reductase-like aldo/keto reductase